MCDLLSATRASYVRFGLRVQSSPPTLILTLAASPECRMILRMSSPALEKRTSTSLRSHLSRLWKRIPNPPLPFVDLINDPDWPYKPFIDCRGYRWTLHATNRRLSAAEVKELMHLLQTCVCIYASRPFITMLSILSAGGV